MFCLFFFGYGRDLEFGRSRGGWKWYFSVFPDIVGMSVSLNDMIKGNQSGRGLDPLLAGLCAARIRDGMGPGKTGTPTAMDVVFTTVHSTPTRNADARNERHCGVRGSISSTSHCRFTSWHRCLVYFVFRACRTRSSNVVPLVYYTCF